MGATIMLRDDFNVLVQLASVDHVLDAEIWEPDAVIEVRQLVLASPLLDLARVSVWTAVAVGTTTVVFLQPLLVLALQLMVENNAADFAASSRMWSSSRR